LVLVLIYDVCAKVYEFVRLPRFELLSPLSSVSLSLFASVSRQQHGQQLFYDSDLTECGGDSVSAGAGTRWRASNSVPGRSRPVLFVPAKSVGAAC
jgi:hypothetical protein